MPGVWKYRLLRTAVRLARRLTRKEREAGGDRQLAARLHAAFEENLADAHFANIQFYVLDGTVSVYGSVRHELDRDLILEVIRSVPGTKKVVPHLYVVGASGDGAQS